jgi:adenylate cyclase
MLDPDNMMVLYNSACSLTYRNADLPGALDLLEEYFERVESPGNILHAEIDPDMDPVRDDPRFVKMLASAKQRVGLREAAE